MSGYVPEPGHLVTVQRWSVPCPELPGISERKLLTEVDGTVASYDLYPDQMGGGSHYRLYLEGLEDWICPDDQFSGQGEGVSWTLRTRITRRVWVSVGSHRARHKLARLAGGDLGPGYGIWPDNGRPRGDYYLVTDRPELHAVKGLRVLLGVPSGGRLFKRW